MSTACWAMVSSTSESTHIYASFALGECSEGSVWESLAFCSFYELDNICAIIDVNRLGQSDPTPLQHHVETYRKRVDAFG